MPDSLAPQQGAALGKALFRSQLKQDYLRRLKPPDPESRCTECARLDRDNFGGNVYGYFHGDNPKAMDLGNEGHDFLITPDNFLIDRWVHDVWGEKPVYDLTHLGDLMDVRRIYGDPSKWEKVGK